IDMGAIKFIAGGADVMVPGIVDADRDIHEGDPVWIRDENHGRAIAVGISLMNGSDLIKLEKGRGVKNIHWVGDRIWKALGEI
ncbi:MAG TPA: RNA-binding protein, partial [Thermoplasmatales archaeon]|nr:RNA-binding protein [Thermoplasmatales archaeon]